MKTKNEILHLLSLYKPTAQSKYGLTRKAARKPGRFGARA